MIPKMKKIKTFKTIEGRFSVWDIDDDHRNRGDMFTVFESPKGWVIRNALLPEEMRRKGIGFHFHMQMNDLSKQKTGKPLRTVEPHTYPDGSVGREFSDNAEKLWDFMVSKGLAVKLDYKKYVMR